MPTRRELENKQAETIEKMAQQILNLAKIADRSLALILKLNEEVVNLKGQKGVKQ